MMVSRLRASPSARRVTEVFYNFCYILSGAAEVIAHDGKWLKLHFLRPILPGITMLKKPANPP